MPLSDPDHFISTRMAARAVPGVPGITIRQPTAQSGLADLYQNLYSDYSEAPFWAFAWGGGIGLARYLLDHPETVSGKSVLDIGTGSGLTAIAAAKSGAFKVVANDIDQTALASVRVNARDNEVSLIVSDTDFTSGPPPDMDVILVGDLFYDQAIADRVLAFLKACRKAGADILIGDPGRQFLPPDALTELACYKGADVGTGPDTSMNRVFRLK